MCVKRRHNDSVLPITKAVWNRSLHKIKGFKFWWRKIRKLLKTNLPFIPFCHRTWRGIIAPTDLFISGLGRQFISVCIKLVYSHCILIPQGSTGSSTFLVSNESPYFSHYNSKISASNSLYFGSYSRKLLISGIPILIFLCIFITASSPVSYSYFCPRRENKKQPWGKIVQNVP